MGAMAMSSSPSFCKTVTTGFCNQLQASSPGGQCGAGIGICGKGYCCSQSGFCSKSATACDGTCQCPYSGVGSGCKGAYPLAGPNPRLLPVADAGGVCGAHSGSCPSGQCCSQFGFCVPDDSIYCLKSSCHSLYSPWSMHCLVKSQQAPVKRFNWVVSLRQMAPDGFTRPVVVVNGQVMVPINVTVGDRIVLRVTNMMAEAISIHFHGMVQHATNTMDGVDGTTQRPIMPRKTFMYNYLAETPGTFWWHSHHHATYMDGLWGPLTIMEPSEPKYAYDAVVAVSDWYQQMSTVLMQSYMSPASMGNEPVPYDALINFKGQGSLSAAALQKVSSYSLVKAAAVSCDDLRTKMARLRFINSGGFAVFNISIDNHRLILIGEDGVLVEPVEVGSFQINNGQRYDVLACQRPEGGAPVSTAPVFIRATMVDSNFPSPSPHNASLAIMYFTKSPPDKLPVSTANFLPPAMAPDMTGEGYINPYEQRILGELVPPAATRRTYFNISFYNEPADDPTATEYAHVNDVSLMMAPEVPSLLERYSSNPQHLGPPTQATHGIGWDVVEIGPTDSSGLMRNDVVDIVINNFDDGEHPIPLHGHWAFVMAAGAPDAGVYMDNIPLQPSLIRDTVTVNPSSYLVLRVLAENPGVWIMHCHIDWHMAAGLALLLREGFPATAP